MNDYIKAQTNVPFKVIFKYDSHLPVKEGQYGEFATWGVESTEGQYLSSGTKTLLYQALKVMEPLKGKEMTLEKVEGEKNKKFWHINGNPASTYLNGPASVANTPDVQVPTNEKDTAIDFVLSELAEIKVLLKSLVAPQVSAPVKKENPFVKPDIKAVADTEVPF